MERLMALLEKQIGANWRDVIAWLQDQNDTASIEAKLAAGDIEGVVSEVDAAAAKFAADTHDAYVTAGKTAAEWLDGKVPDALIRFDQTNTRAVDRAKANEMDLVTGLVQEQREMIRNVIADGLTRGANPLDMARDIRTGIGLTPDQERAVRSYRRALEQADYANALGRELRDGRGDRSLLAAQRDDRSLPQAQIDRLVDQYRANFVTHRAETIARTEGLRAANEGASEAMRQAIDRGEVDADQLVKTWNAGPRTAHSRPMHQAMDGVSVGVLEDFTLPDGTKMPHPGVGPVEHVANCRCVASTAFAD